VILDADDTGPPTQRSARLRRDDTIDVGVVLLGHVEVHLADRILHIQLVLKRKSLRIADQQHPPLGVIGDAIFTYTAFDNGNRLPWLCSVSATVTVTVSGPPIWFVDPASATNGDGRLSDPYSTLRSASGVDAAYHAILVFSGTAASGITLKSGESLVGQGLPGTGVTFDTVFGLTPPAGMIARPTLGGTAPYSRARSR
jgi:hypothetical protein